LDIIGENIMKKENKKLMKKFQIVIKDLMDNYNQYTDEEKAQVKEVFQKVADLNTILDKYDVEKRSHWAEFVAAYGNYFDPIID
jgi:predicted methyltransferase